MEINGRVITHPVAQVIAGLAGTVGGIALGVGLGVGITSLVLGTLATASLIGAPIGIPMMLFGGILIGGGAVLGAGSWYVGFPIAYAIDLWGVPRV